MNKIVIPALLVATIIVAGAFAFAPVEQASTTHFAAITIAGGITPVGAAAVNIASAAGDVNVITVGNVAEADTIALNSDTTIVGDTTIGSGTADTFNWASDGGDTYNIATGVAAETVNIGTEATAVDVITFGDSSATIGFFGQPAATQQTAPTTITGLGIGTGNNVLATVIQTNTQDASANINDNFVDLAVEINTIRTILVNLGLAA